MLKLGLVKGQYAENEGYYAVKTLFSFEDVMAGLQLTRERFEVDPVYTVDNMGEDYTVIYHFTEGHSYTKYPIDFETYFSTKSYGHFTTYIMINNQECPGCGYNGKCNKTGIFIYKGDENYERVMEYKESTCAYVKISENENVIPIENINLLSYSHRTNTRHYDVTYDGEKIMTLYSCVELNNEFFDRFFDSIVTTEVVE